MWSALLFPSLALDVFARAFTGDDHGRPFVVTSGGHYPRVVVANAAARGAGIERDQLISAALALVPDVVMRERDPRAESEALSEIATLALVYTSNVCLAPPWSIVAEVGASQLLFGGLRNLLSRLAADIQARGYMLSLGLAPTPEAALLLARAGEATPVLHREALPEALAPIGLVNSGLDPVVVEALGTAGITTFGQAAALPRDGLARRFGDDVVTFIDRALGRQPDPRIPFTPPPHFSRRLELPTPVADSEALGFALHRLISELATWLTVRGLGVTQLELELKHERYLRERGMPPTLVPFALGAPTRTGTHLFGTLRERLARVALPAPVEIITLSSEEVVPLAGHNLGLLPGDDTHSSDVPLLDRLRARLGDDAVVLIAPRADHRPELAEKRVRLDFSHLSAPEGRRVGQIASDSPFPTLPPRPLWLLNEPQPLSALLEAAPWVLKDGPERIESGWWDGRDFRRDYFVAESPAGELVWIYRDHRYGLEAGEWFLHGWFG
jgi:protein ImuB